MRGCEFMKNINTIKVKKTLLFSFNLIILKFQEHQVSLTVKSNTEKDARTWDDTTLKTDDDDDDDDDWRIGKDAELKNRVCV